MRQLGSYTFKILSPTLTHGAQRDPIRLKIPVYGNSETVLELQFQSELNLPRIGVLVRGCNDAGGRGDGARRREDGSRRNPEIRMIQDVEEFRAELRAEPFRKLRIFRKQDVHIEEARTAQSVA